jgi:hypothetical protein
VARLLVVHHSPTHSVRQLTDAGAVRSVLSIVQALPWRQAADVLEVLGDVGEAETAAAYELGGTLAALLME